jgi:FKBP-type peptidyl-prolyl cis-trans isomerase
MKNLVIALTLTAALAAAAFAQEADKKEAAAPSNDKVLYTLGYLLGNNLKEQLVLESEDDSKAISQGMRDSMLGRASQTDIELYKPLIAKRYEEDAVKIIANRKAEQEKVLAELKKDSKNNKVLGNGALIRTVKKGKGKSPKASSMVKVHYEGTLLDGTVFDSSIKRGTPAQFPLNGVIPCWTEGLQKMKTGEKAKLYCPPATAYGDRQAGAIPPGSLLMFDVELLEITD